MAIHSSASFPDALNPVFRSQVDEGFTNEGDAVSKWYEMKSSDRNQEQYGTMSQLPEFEAFDGALSYVQLVEGYSITVTHKQFAQGVQVKRQLWDDDQHGLIKQIFQDFGYSAWLTRQKDALQPWNNAFTNDTEFYTHDEGVSLCNASHTTPVGGVSTTTGFSNITTDELSATALATARFTMRKFKDYQGEPINEVPTELFVPVEKEDEAFEINRTRMGLDTAGDNVNVQAGRFTVSSDVRLTDLNNWFVHNTRLRKRNLFWIDRVPMETKRMEDFDHLHFKGRGYMRYSYGRLLWQWIYGGNVG